MDAGRLPAGACRCAFGCLKSAMTMNCQFGGSAAAPQQQEGRKPGGCRSALQLRRPQLAVGFDSALEPPIWRLALEQKRVWKPGDASASQEQGSTTTACSRRASGRCIPAPPLADAGCGTLLLNPFDDSCADARMSQAVAARVLLDSARSSPLGGIGNARRCGARPRPCADGLASALLGTGCGFFRRRGGCCCPGYTKSPRGCCGD